IAFYFISDAMLTIQQFFAIYFSEVWQLSDSMKVLLLSFLFIGAIPGAYFSGILCHKFSPKKLLLWICTLINVLIFSLTIAPPQKYLLYILILSMGIGWGSFYTVARTLFVNISPKNRIGEYFGFYSVFQRFASFIGPLIWSLSIFVFSKSLIKYQITVFLLAIMMAVGIFIMMRVEEKGSKVSSGS
ncbi:MAG: MFS transporter, partial [Candidatus Aenigmarchaeota archaeon]|nr:MFS transporter [Candidatus Aenigmarchaeota archaeon]